MIKKRYYAGIGSRKTPVWILKQMTQIAKYLDKQGYILNSGGANGADNSFSEGTFNRQVIIPKSGFNGYYPTSDKTVIDLQKISSEKFDLATNIAKKYHPYFDNLNQYSKWLHTRNVLQVLGIDLKTKVDFVICYTQNAETTGGTATAIKIALDYNIPVLNLGKYKNKVDYKKNINDDLKQLLKK